MPPTRSHRPEMTERTLRAAYPTRTRAGPGDPAIALRARATRRGRVPPNPIRCGGSSVTSPRPVRRRATAAADLISKHARVNQAHSCLHECAANKHAATSKRQCSSTPESALLVRSKEHSDPSVLHSPAFKAARASRRRRRVPSFARKRGARWGWASAGAMGGEPTVVCPAVQPAGAPHCDATCR
jgi:hypothetical protein